MSWSSIRLRCCLFVKNKLTIPKTFSFGSMGVILYRITSDERVPTKTPSSWRTNYRHCHKFNKNINKLNFHNIFHTFFYFFTIFFTGYTAQSLIPSQYFNPNSYTNPPHNPQLKYQYHIINIPTPYITYFTSMLKLMYFNIDHIPPPYHHYYTYTSPTSYSNPHNISPPQYQYPPTNITTQYYIYFPSILTLMCFHIDLPPILLSIQLLYPHKPTLHI